MVNEVHRNSLKIFVPLIFTELSGQSDNISLIVCLEQGAGVKVKKLISDKVGARHFLSFSRNNATVYHQEKEPMQLTVLKILDL